MVKIKRTTMVLVAHVALLLIYVSLTVNTKGCPWVIEEWQHVEGGDPSGSFVGCWVALQFFIFPMWTSPWNPFLLLLLFLQFHIATSEEINTTDCFITWGLHQISSKRSTRTHFPNLSEPSLSPWLAACHELESSYFLASRAWASLQRLIQFDSALL